MSSSRHSPSTFVVVLLMVRAVLVVVALDMAGYHLCPRSLICCGTGVQLTHVDQRSAPQSTRNAAKPQSGG